MENMLFNQLQGSERKVLAVFERYGADGRAITVETVAVNAGMKRNVRELAAALQNLTRRGVIRQAGQDPLPGSPVAFRLAVPLPGRERVVASNLPMRRSPPLSPDAEETRRNSDLQRRARLTAD